MQKKAAIIRFLGDILQCLTFTMIAMLVINVAFSYTAYRLFRTNGEPPAWHARYASVVYFYLPAVFFFGGLVTLRLARRFGKDIQAFRVTRIF